jgi:hypothetical protein
MMILINATGIGLLLWLMMLLSRRSKGHGELRQRASQNMKSALWLFLFVSLSQTVQSIDPTVALKLAPDLQNLWTVTQGLSVVGGIVLMLHGASRWDSLGREFARQRAAHALSEQALIQRQRAYETSHPLDPALLIDVEREVVDLRESLAALDTTALPAERLHGLYRTVEKALTEALGADFFFIELCAGSGGAQALKRATPEGSLVRSFFPATRSLTQDRRFQNSQGLFRRLPVVDTRISSAQINREGLKEAIYTLSRTEHDTRLLVFFGSREHGTFSERALEVLAALTDAIPAEFLNGLIVTPSQNRPYTARLARYLSDDSFGAERHLDASSPESVQ